MSSDKHSARGGYAEQLAEFERQIGDTSHAIDLEPEVFRSIRELLTKYKDSDQDIRRIVTERHEAGKLREEKLHLVEQVVAGLTSEHVNTVPDDERTTEFSQTVVLPPSAVAEKAAPDPDPLQPGSVLRDRFMLQQRISGGSMGVVYKALDRRMAEVEGMERWVAIKVLTTKLSRNADALRAMQQEAAKIRSVSHPNIVRFIDLDRDEDVYFIVMEWIDGRSLAAVLDDPETRDISLKRSLNILRQLGGALEYLHGSHVVHADVKPGNVMLTPGDEVKLIDFGVARIRRNQESGADQFDPKVLGAATPAYSSMQVLTGEDPVPADDVFSLACVAYRLCAGRRAFGPKNAAEAAEEGMTPERPEGLSDGQWKALKKALSFARVSRYDSPQAFVDALLENEHVATVPIAAARAETIAADETAQRSPSREPFAAPERSPSRASAATGGFSAAERPAMMEFVPQDEPDEDGFRDTERFDEQKFDDHQLDEPNFDAPRQDDDSSFVLRADDAGGIFSPTEGLERWQPLLLGALVLAVLGGLAIRYDWLEGILPEPVAAIFAGDEGAADTSESIELPVEPRGEPSTAAADMAPVTPESTPDQPIDDQPFGTPLTSLSDDAPADEPSAADVADDEPLSDELVSDLPLANAPGESAPSDLETSGDEADDGPQPVSNPGISTADETVAGTFRPSGTAAQSDPDDRDDGAGAVLGNGVAEAEREAFGSAGVGSGPRRDAVGFALRELIVSEGAIAIQIDVQRYRPTGEAISVEFSVRDESAGRDQDYFPPIDNTIRFAAGQSSTRLLMPLVQDAEAEPDEVFFVELTGDEGEVDADVIRRVEVVIRDDDS